MKALFPSKFQEFFFLQSKAFIIALLGCFINNRHCKNYKRKGTKIEGKENKNPKENYVTF